MKKILLLGDSIRMGYDEFVQKRLDGKAEVFYHEDNGRFAQYTLRTLENWKADLKLDNVDLVHWNNGLWDVLHLNAGEVVGDGEAEGTTLRRPSAESGKTVAYDKDPLTPPAMYGYMIGRIHRRIGQLFPGAKIVFAASTPVIEEQASWAFRSNAEIRQYNEIARNILAPFGVRFNDLYSFAEKNCSRLHCDWVHYTPEGSDLLASEVVRFLGF